MFRSHPRFLRPSLVVMLCTMPFWAPWQLLVAGGVLGLLLFRRFWEIIPIFLIIDLFYGLSVERFGGFPFFMTLAAVFLYGLVQFLAKYMRVPHNSIS